MSRFIRLLVLLSVCSFAPVLFAQADLTLDSFATFSRLAPGSSCQVSAGYDNFSSVAATDVKLTITIPPGFLYEGYQTGYDGHPSPFSCTEPPKDGPGDLVCTAPSVAGNDYGYVAANVRVDPAAVPGTVITLSATLTCSNAVKPSQTISGATTVIQPTNLRIEMSAPASATAGDTFTITVTATNDGPATAEYTELDFAREGNVQWGRLTGPPGWTCAISCTIGSFPPGTATFTITATTNPATPLTSVVEQTSVYSFSDPNYADNTATGSTTIIALPHADLTLSAVADKTTVIQGQVVTNTYTVTNNGPDSATNVELQIGFPGSLSSVTSTFASCTQTEPVQCAAPSLAPGGTLTATVSFAPDQLGTFSPHAQLQWSNNPLTVGFVTASTSLQVIPDPAQPADLSAAVTMPSTVVYNEDGGATAAGHFTVTNAGPSTAQNVSVGFAGAAEVDLPGFTCGPDGGGYRCTAASMAPGSVTGTLTAAWPTAPNGTLETTTVTATSASTDPNTTNNSASAQTTVLWQSNLTLQDLSMPSPIPPGNAVVMTAHYVNSGPSPATGVKITITVPSGATYDGYSTTSNAFQCTEPPKGGQGDLVCTASSLDSGGGGSIEVFVRADPADTPGTVITFPATLTCPTALQPSQSITGSFTVAAPANLKVTLSSPPAVAPGDSYANIVTVTNMGPGNALNVSTVLALTGSNYITSVSGPPGWGCAPGVNIATCSIASFPPGTATFTFTTAVLVNFQSGTLTQTATATSIVDPDNSNNVATSTTTITRPSLTPVSLQFTASAGSVTSGGTLTYTARIVNSGSVDAENADLTLNVPGTVLTTTCGSVDRPHCTFPTIAAGATQTVTATTRIDAPPGSSVIADAILLGANLLNDIPTTSVTTIVSGGPAPAGADLSASVDAPSSANVGGLVTFTVDVTNAGTLDASNVSVQQTLPPGLTFASASDGCSGSPVVTCTTPLLASGASATFTITATATAAGTVTMTSTAATTSPEQNTANNSATATVVINTPVAPARRRAARH